MKILPIRKFGEPKTKKNYTTPYVSYSISRLNNTTKDTDKPKHGLNQ